MSGVMIFLRARNYAAGKAENNIIICADTDEIIESLNVQESMVEDGKAVGRILESINWSVRVR